MIINLLRHSNFPEIFTPPPDMSHVVTNVDNYPNFYGLQVPSNRTQGAKRSGLS